MAAFCRQVACAPGITAPSATGPLQFFMRCLTASLRQNAGTTNPALIGLGHLDFTVTDGDRAVRWWQEVMGFKLLAEWAHAVFRAWTMAHSCGLVVTAVMHEGGDASAFDERRVGLARQRCVPSKCGDVPLMAT
jgi:catechol-2,3-dioxygenase